MLVILDRAPVTAPAEALGTEQATGQVVTGNLVGKSFVAVGITGGCGRLDDATAIAHLHTGVVQRIQIDGQALGVLRESRGPCHRPVTETGSVIGLHGPLVVIAVLTDGTDALYRIAGFIELAEDVKQVFSNVPMAHKKALLGLSIEIYVQHPQLS